MVHRKSKLFVTVTTSSSIWQLHVLPLFGQAYFHSKCVRFPSSSDAPAHSCNTSIVSICAMVKTTCQNTVGVHGVSIIRPSWGIPYNCTYIYICILYIHIYIYNVYINPYWGNDHDGPISYMANWPNWPNFENFDHGIMAQISASFINKSLVIWSCSCMKSESFPSAKDGPLTLRLREW